MLCELSIALEFLLLVLVAGQHLYNNLSCITQALNRLREARIDRPGSAHCARRRRLFDQTGKLTKLK